MDASERLIADSLSRHASDAPSDDELLDAVHHRLRRRRTGRTIGAIVLACAVVATAFTVTHSWSQLRTDPEVAQSTAGWRWESYKTVEVQVPDSWNQYISGPAPCTTFSTSSAPVVGRFNGWLGSESYTCEEAVLPVERRLPYLWFNDVQAPGIKHYDAGWTEETRAVAGVKLSVLTKDDSLRRRILDSARPITTTDHYGCTPTDTGARGTGLDLADRITSAGVCEYWQGSLVAGSQLTGQSATEFAHRLATSPEGPAPTRASGCESPQFTLVVTLHGRTKSYPVRITDGCFLDPFYPADDGVTQRRIGPDVLELFQTGVHNPNEPSALYDPATPLTPSPR